MGSKSEMGKGFLVVGIMWIGEYGKERKKERDRDDDIGSEAFCVGDQPFNTSGYLLALHSV